MGMNSDPMIQALQRNKTKALDITILLGTPGDGNVTMDAGNSDDMTSDPNQMETDEEKQEREEMDMAPPAEQIGDDQLMPDASGADAATSPDKAQLFAQELGKTNYGPGGSMLNKKKPFPGKAV